MSLRRNRPGAATAGLGGLALVLAACGSPDSITAAGAPTVVASTNVYGAVAEAVGGARVQARSLIDDPAGDPHSYESTPADAAAVRAATVFVYNGGGYDEFAAKLAESAGGGSAAIDVAELSGLGAAAPAGAEFNEHVWYSLPTMKKLADRLAVDLAAASPADAMTFAANAAAFGAEIDGLTAKLEAIKAAHEGVRVAITEPVSVYLIEAAGLQNATPEEFAEAIEEDTDPPAAVLQETLALFSTAPVRVLVLNAQTQSPTTDRVRQAAVSGGVPVVEVTETLPGGVTGYTTWMSNQIDALAGALDRR